MFGTTEDFVIAEGDRPFLSAVLHAYAKRMRTLLEEAQHGSADAGASISQAAARAENMARQINPTVHYHGVITGLKFPR